MQPPTATETIKSVAANMAIKRFFTGK